MSSLRQEYMSYVSSAAWPTNLYRVGVVYNTMSRAIRNASEPAKRYLFDSLCAIGDEFQKNIPTIIRSQSTFDAWHADKIRDLKGISFNWTDGSGGRHTNLTLGLAQKFLNLMLKDWWATGACGNCDYSVLHAPFDNVVWNVLWELRPRFDCPSLKSGSTYKGISHWDSNLEYRSYQAHLLSAALSQDVMRQMRSRLRQFETEQPPATRIEMEQLLWQKG